MQRFPGQGIRRLCEGITGLTSERLEREVQAFVRDRQIHLGGKTLEQFLEQLHIAVELRRRGRAGRCTSISRDGRVKSRSGSPGREPGLPWVFDSGAPRVGGEAHQLPSTSRAN